MLLYMKDLKTETVTPEIKVRWGFWKYKQNNSIDQVYCLNVIAFGW